MNERQIPAKDIRRGDVITVDGEDHTVVSSRFITGRIEIEVTDLLGAYTYAFDELVTAWIPPPSVGYQHDDQR